MDSPPLDSLFREAVSAIDAGDVDSLERLQSFQAADGSWFCFVVEDADGKLIGFAKGQHYAHSDQRDFAGELNKIYLLREYHRRGLGRRLVLGFWQRTGDGAAPEALAA
jgi:GNAT superfamily N-acetyltransferase